MAVAGLPEPMQEHAEVMAHFEHEYNVELIRSVKKLGVTYGPDTGVLVMRFGFHSGPIREAVLKRLGRRGVFMFHGRLPTFPLLQESLVGPEARSEGRGIGRRRTADVVASYT
jgi:hypothetical protein